MNYGRPVALFEPIFGWERHRREQVIAILQTTPTQRLRWLGSAIRFAAQVGALPRTGRHETS